MSKEGWPEKDVIRPTWNRDDLVYTGDDAVRSARGAGGGNATSGAGAAQTLVLRARHRVAR